MATSLVGKNEEGELRLGANYEKRCFNRYIGDFIDDVQKCCESMTAKKEDTWGKNNLTQ
jgi:hypothetical protein